MVQAMSLFNQLLRHFPNREFAALVTDSLRQICNGPACCLGGLIHLGIGVAPHKYRRRCMPISVGPLECTKSGRRAQVAERIGAFAFHLIVRR
jgi:hypothetical protein